MRNLKSSISVQEVFEDVYSENFDRLFLYARTITKSAELAKDVVSDVFVDLWDHRSRLSKIRDIESYLFISVKNHAIRIVSNNQNNLHTNDLESTIKNIDRIDPEEILLEKELLDLIENEVSLLPDQCQLIFRMAKDKQMKYKEIALELGISSSTVKTQLVKGISIIRTAICNQYGDSIDENYANKSSLANLLILLHFSLMS